MASGGSCNCPIGISKSVGMALRCLRDVLLHAARLSRSFQQHGFVNASNHQNVSVRHDNEVDAIGPAEHLAKGQRNKDSECVGSLAVPAYVFLPHASVVITPWGRFENGGFFWYAPPPPFPPVCPSASNEREYKPGIGYGYLSTLVQLGKV